MEMAEAKELLAALKKVGDDDARALDILNALDGAEANGRRSFWKNKNKVPAHKKKSVKH